VAELRGRRRQPARRAAPPGASCLFLLAGTGCNSCLGFFLARCSFLLCLHAAFRVGMEAFI
jgi:hypothetical protein